MSANSRSEPLRLGLLFEYGSLNGGEFSLLSVLDELDFSSVIPVAICPAESPLARQLERRKIECRFWPSGSDQLQDNQDLANWLNFQITGHRLQLLHANSLTMSRRLGAIAPLLTVPATGHVRDIMKLSDSARKGLSNLHHLVCVSDATRTSLIAQGLNPLQLSTVYNGIDVSRFQPRPASGWLRRQLNLPSSAKLVATIGQICLRKGQTDLAHAAVLLRDHLPELHFLIVGERHSSKTESVEFDNEIDHIFESAGMGDRLHRLPFQSEIHLLLNEIDLLVHPARQEPLGRVLLEAAASGLPVVATAVGGTPEILVHAESAWLVPPGNPESLAAGIHRLITDRPLAQQLGGAARQVILKRFTAKSCSTATLELWNTVIRT